MATETETDGLTADLVILGSGGGMAAAVTAAEAGVKDIIVVEKQGVLGGNTRLAGGFFACESPVQQRAGIKTSTDEYFKLAMKWHHGHIADPRILRAYIDTSGDTVRWLEEKGVKFEEKTGKPGEPRGNHQPVGRGLKLMEVLVKRAEALGIRTMLHTSGRKIIREPGGGVTGVTVADRNGREFEIKAKGVIIATGGFPGNVELLKKYCPDFSEKMLLGKWPYHTGDGLLMAAAAGAAVAEVIPIFHVGPVPAGGSWGGLANAVREPFMVWVNKRGQRYIDESGYATWENGNAIRLQPDMETYTIFDARIKDIIEGKGLLTALGWGKAPWEELDQPADQDGMIANLVERGMVDQYDSWEEAASHIGAKPAVLQATIEEYNQACDQGRDPVFAKDPQYLLPLRQPPYYVVRCYVHTGETMGGVRVTERMEALDTEEKVIPGLYVASVLAHGWSGQTYPADELGGSAFGFALHSGRIAGRSVASYLSDQ